MTSNICVKKLPKRIIERPGLFVDSFHNTLCPESIDTLELIANEFEIAISQQLTKPSLAKNCLKQIESTLFALGRLPCTAATKKLQILAALLREATESTICCGKMLQVPLAHIQNGTLLNLVSNFIREWRGRPCETRARLKIREFCGDAISDEARLGTVKLCCDKARRLNLLLNEWISLRVSQDARTEGDDSSEEVRGAEVPARPGVETNHRGGEIADGDVPWVNGDHRSLRRGKTAASAGEARTNGVGSARSADAAAAERIRAKRDNNLYRRELDGVEDKDRQDRRSAQRDVEEEEEEEAAANGSRSVAGKRGRDAEDTEEAKENGAAEQRIRVSGRRDPYRQRRAEERSGTRLPDNGARQIDRFNRSNRSKEEEKEEKDAEISAKKPAKRHQEETGNSRRRDRRREEPNLPTTRADRMKKVKEDKDRLEEETKNPSGSKKATASFVAEEGGKVGASGEGKREGATTVGGARHNPHWTANWRGEIGKNGNLFDSSNSIKYQLSSALFVQFGWTSLPIARAMRKIVRYEAKPAKPYVDWFKIHKEKGTEYYDGARTPFLKFHPDGSGELFYPNGVLAVKVDRPKNRNYDMYTVFTPGGKDALGVERESQMLAIFDTMGHGVVFNEDSAARLSYNQTGGIFTDSPAGLPLVWTWNVNPRRESMLLQTVCTERLAERLQTEFFSESTQSPGNAETPISPSGTSNKKKKVVEAQEPVVVGERRGKVKIELGTILDFDKEASSYMIEATDRKRDMLRCRFQDKLCTKLKSDSSLHDLAKEYRKTKKIAKQRKCMIAKYKPFFQ